MDKMCKFPKPTINFNRVIHHLLKDRDILPHPKIRQVSTLFQTLQFSSILHIRSIHLSLCHPFQMAGGNLLPMINGECHRVNLKQTINMVFGEGKMVRPLGKKVIFGHQLKDHQ
ncbi:hypothetical protein PIB30_035077 [Stylosanthes scabra]|uniref:Uncharacterized protein n=1 Tax=Stylosanthes scabra TaxID=79078 RepID=A0ABU6QCE7_9FABA|nr:hypothetical protein [Stylosanthes scabra]